MNLLDILKARIDSLSNGDYTLGLKSVLQHVEIAEKHLLRGQREADDTAFTDAIYRTNQAFEGSLKEAFRVLAQKDPSKETPNNIETYFQNNKTVRHRVLAQFTNYRKEWRNPSTHDYRLDFDEDEALLAIVTVSAFAIVLIDQITEAISREQARLNASALTTSISTIQELLDHLPTLIEQFVSQFNVTHADQSDVREVGVVGAIAGFLAATAPNLMTQIEPILVPDKPERADLIVTQENEKVIFEIKRIRSAYLTAIQIGINQVSRYMEISGIKNAVLLLFNTADSKILNKVNKVVEHPVGADGKIIVISANLLSS